MRTAWKGEASDFTPLLAERLDALGEALGIALVSHGESEVATTGGRRIDIVVEDVDGTEFVIENQYGKADHDHLTRGLAYAVARGARGLVVVAEEHRDEFRAVADYLNEVAEHHPDHGISVWLVEVKAVRIDGSNWAPLFLPVVQPNAFTAATALAKQSEARYWTRDEYFDAFTDPMLRSAAKDAIDRWEAREHASWQGKGYWTLIAKGPSKNGNRSVVSLRTDGVVTVPFSSYAGSNAGVPVESLVDDDFRARAAERFGFSGTDKTGRTAPGWLTPERVDMLLEFCDEVADKYAAALAETEPPTD